MLRQDSPNLSHLVSNSGKRVKVRAGLRRKKLKNGPPRPGIEPQNPQNDEKRIFSAQKMRLLPLDHGDITYHKGKKSDF